MIYKISMNGRGVVYDSDTGQIRTNGHSSIFNQGAGAYVTVGDPEKFPAMHLAYVIVHGPVNDNHYVYPIDGHHDNCKLSNIGIRKCKGKTERYKTMCNNRAITNAMNRTEDW